MENLIYFAITFTIVFLTLLVNYFIKKKKGDLSSSKEIDLICVRYQIPRKKIDAEKIGLIFALINSLIISTVGVISSTINLGYIWQIIIGFFLIMALIYVTYGFVGLSIKRKIKNEKRKKNV